MANRYVPTLKYFKKGTWREVHPFDQGKADQFRRFLCKLALYPLPSTEPPESERLRELQARGRISQEANARAILHVVADELDELDAVALSEIAALLLGEPRSPQVMEEYQRDNQMFIELLTCQGTILPG